MPRLHGDLLAKSKAQLVDTIDKGALVANASLYKRWIPTPEWQWASGQVDQAPIGTGAQVLKLGKPASGETTGVIASVRIEEFWVKGKVRLTLYYSGNNDTGAYAINVNVLVIEDDGDIAGTPVTVVDTLAAPSAANMLTTAVVSSFDVDANDEVLFIKFERVYSGDVNAGNLYLLGGMLQFWPDRSRL